MDLFGEPETVIEEDDHSDASFLTEDHEELFLSPRAMTFCEGQENAEKKLLELFKSQRIPHGLIFTGPKGIGKATMAFRFARFILKRGNIDPNQNSMFDDEPAYDFNSLNIPTDDRVFRQVLSGGHPDLLTIERAYDATKDKTQDSLAVSELRKVEPFLRKTASEGGWRIVIIDDADTMNRNAQNALLKILEEPPKKTIIILIAHRAGALIPTIRSRTQMMKLNALEPETITNLLGRNNIYVDPFQGEVLTAMAQGSLGKAMQMMEEGGLDMLETTLSYLEKTDWPAIHQFAEQIGKASNGKEYKNFTETIQFLFKTLTFAKARGLSIQPAGLNKEPLTQILQNSSLASLLKVCENLSDCFETTERANLDKRQAVLNAFQIINA